MTHSTERMASHFPRSAPTSHYRPHRFLPSTKMSRCLVKCHGIVGVLESGVLGEQPVLRAEKKTRTLHMEVWWSFFFAQKSTLATVSHFSRLTRRLLGIPLSFFIHPARCFILFLFTRGVATWLPQHILCPFLCQIWLRYAPFTVHLPLGIPGTLPTLRQLSAF